MSKLRQRHELITHYSSLITILCRYGLRPLRPSLFEILQRLVQVLFNIVRHGFLFPQRLQNTGMRVFDEAQQLSFKRAHVRDRQVVRGSS